MGATREMNVTQLDDHADDEVEEAPHLWAGDSVDHYEVLLLLGRGAMGEVYLAQDTKLGRKVALKLMRPEMFQNEEAARRFQNEARAMAQINHPNVVTIHAVGEYRDVPYVAMEFVRGQSLYERLDAGLDDDEALRIALAVANALREAHELGIVHRDLKPENVIAGRDGTVSVLDFGLAKTVSLGGEDSFADTPMPSEDETMTRLGSRVGTPLYMSPEQWKMAEITTATDVWAFGVLLFEMYTGQVPFRGVDLADLAHRICDPDTAPPLAPDIPPAIQGLIARCLRRNPTERPTISQVIAALERIAAPVPAPAPISFPAPPPAASPRRWPLVAGAAAILVGGVAIGMTLGADTPAEGGKAPVASSAVPEAQLAASASPAAAEEGAMSKGEASEGEAPAATGSAASTTTVATPHSVAPKPVAPRPVVPRPAKPRAEPASKDPFSEPPSNAGY